MRGFFVARPDFEKWFSPMFGIGRFDGPRAHPV
jgi:hypothetical protein